MRDRIRDSVKTLKRVWFELTDPKSSWTPDNVQGVQGWAFIQNLSITRANDQHINVSFTLTVDGKPADYIAA